MRSGWVTASWTLFCLPLLAVCAPAERSPRTVVEHHIAALLAHDGAALVGDYADDAVVVLVTGVFSGREQIQQLFSGVHADGTPTPTMRIESIAGDVVVEEYVRSAPDGAVIRGEDVIVVRHGRIVFQATRAKPANAPVR